jgi:hypothetical protein
MEPTIEQLLALEIPLDAAPPPPRSHSQQQPTQPSHQPQPHQQQAMYVFCTANKRRVLLVRSIRFLCKYVSGMLDRIYISCCQLCRPASVGYGIPVSEPVMQHSRSQTQPQAHAQPQTYTPQIPQQQLPSSQPQPQQRSGSSQSARGGSKRYKNPLPDDFLRLPGVGLPPLGDGPSLSQARDGMGTVGGTGQGGYSDENVAEVLQNQEFVSYLVEDPELVEQLARQPHAIRELGMSENIYLAAVSHLLSAGVRLDLVGTPYESLLAQYGQPTGRRGHTHTHGHQQQQHVYGGYPQAQPPRPVVSGQPAGHPTQLGAGQPAPGSETSTTDWLKRRMSSAVAKFKFGGSSPNTGTGTTTSSAAPKPNTGRAGSGWSFFGSKKGYSNLAGDQHVETGRLLVLLNLNKGPLSQMVATRAW